MPIAGGISVGEIEWGQKGILDSAAGEVLITSGKVPFLVVFLTMQYLNMAEFPYFP
jgi:hypothetical protein